MMAVVIDFKSPLIVDDMGDKTRLALSRAINRTADRMRTRAARAALDQVAFPASYVSPSSKRLWVRHKAPRTGPFEAIIEGRGQPTSLARFTRQKPLTGGRRPKGGAVNVAVKPGVQRTIKRAFLINLRNNNIGLAVRTSGGMPPGAYKPKEIGKNLWLLYGPSVDQALSSASDGDGIYADLQGEALDFLNDEFNRQIGVLNAS